MKEHALEFVDERLRTPTLLELNGGIWPIRLGINKAKPNHHSVPRVIRYYTLHFIMEGSVILTHKGEAIDLRKGDLFCLFPGEVYHYKIANPEQTLRMYWLGFDGMQSEGLLAKIGIMRENPYTRSKVTDAALATLHLISSLFLCVDDQDTNLLSLTYRLFHQVSEQSSGAGHSPHDSSWVQKSIDYMKLHFSEGILVEDVARHVAKERSHFSKTFFRVTGINPVVYLQSLKMEKGGQMLLKSSHSITEIALSVGYPDLYSFTRAFKKHFGISPTLYKE
ncbi:AraC family transcriptional regulator [Paenibacillus allorhizosphaerae]|uniref:HTH-type transcriptional activator RhaS n=1 Tax=Paenibacillus allorhizosphaerae TaxID=2849866 RepID=A0ABM8VMR3_9BACL|nr:AraC family transcriptional regulator [Paenibacillus allorhizosphaerae]CAG7650243.1 HTH-type transcriptional activator RhaS [Paenibacillus allorhizosphaerae]